MSLEFGGALDAHLLTGSGYYDEEYDQPEPVCIKCGRVILGVDPPDMCPVCATEGSDEETLDEEG